MSDEREALARVDGWQQSQPWPDPTPEMLESPMFEAIWQTIKTWDISVPSAYPGRCGATGNHVRAIMEAAGWRRSPAPVDGHEAGWQLGCSLSLSARSEAPVAERRAAD